MPLKLKAKGITLQLTWYEIWGWGVMFGMWAFGLWGFYDGIEIGSSRAGWRFLLLFIMFTLPGFIIMVLFKPNNRLQKQP